MRTGVTQPSPDRRDYTVLEVVEGLDVFGQSKLPETDEMDASSFSY